MATIYIDGERHVAKDGENLLQQCLTLGFDLPYFCWHPALHSVGACRQCAVKQFKDERDARGKLVMACMTPVSEGARISIQDAEAREFRSSVIEWLMVNHPHDCPVCDEGGECHLQDMTVMTGHAYRRYRGLKRTFRNQDLGPFVNHEMNRCIQCYRCVRFYRDYAGGRDLDAHALRNLVYFGRHADGMLESEFSGNLVEVCPTGVFTDKTLKRHYTRKWDLQCAPSVCVHCGLGCNTLPGERYGSLRRVHNRYNGDVNGYFLCDRGRFGYEFVNAGSRVRSPLVAADRRQALQAISRQEVLERVRAMLKGSRGIVGIGSPRASLEANFALRTLVGADHFHLGVSAREHELLDSMISLLREGPARTPSMRETERCDAVLVLGEDLTNTAPMLALALRQSVRQEAIALAAKLRIPHWDDAAVREAAGHRRSPLFIASTVATKLDDIATEVWRGAPDELARLAFDIGSAIAKAPSETQQLAERVARALSEAKRPLVVSGLSSGSEVLLRAAASIACALCEKDRPAQLSFTVPECNSLGLALMRGKPLEDALSTVREGKADTVVVLENDLYRRANAGSIDALLEEARQLIVIDHTMHATAQRSDVVLPAGTFAESDGTLVNNEGRAQRFYQVFVPDDDIQESWRLLMGLFRAIGRGENWSSLDEVTSACAAAIPALAGIVRAAPDAGFRIAGQKIAREPHRYSGRTAMSANIDVHEARTPADPDSALAFSMEGFPGEPPSALISHFWAPGWNSVQSVNKFQEEVGATLRGGNPGVRLIEPAKPAKRLDFGKPPQPQESVAREWLLVPLHHIFGSEELSALAPGVSEVAAKPYLALNADDAAELHLAPREQAELRLGAKAYRLPVELRTELKRGIAGLPVDLPGLQGIALPSKARIAKASAS